MSNDTELFELCKEVYKRTGWANTLQFYDIYLNDKYEIETEGGWESEGASYSFDGRHNIPLYTSDGLLEKLPKELHKDITIYYLNVSSKFGDEFKANYVSPTGYLYLFMEPEADTPLKALLKLTIALHEAGELR